MSRPYRTLLWILVFLMIAGVLLVVIREPLTQAFMANAPFNALIVGILIIGIGINLRQVLTLFGAASWVETYRRTDPERRVGKAPSLLAPMARMLGTRERGEFSLSTTSTRSLLDSLRFRLDESRDVSRYIIGLLIFLGLLGTFWGLLQTIGSVSNVINGLAVDDNDGLAAFAALKQGLQQPLAGMGVAFSSSLFGLAGSLVVGFVDLQAGHAQNQFFNELEEWLSGITRLSSGALPGDGEGSVPAYVQALLEQTADSLERLQRAVGDQDHARNRLEGQLEALTNQLGALSQSLGANSNDRFSEELRQEFRLLNRTIAAALKPDRSD